MHDHYRPPQCLPCMCRLAMDHRRVRCVLAGRRSDCEGDMSENGTPLGDEALAEIEVRHAKIDGAPWRYEKVGQTVWGKSLGGCSKTMSDYMVANIRGWGHLQYMGDERGDKKAAAMQDANGEFIGHAPIDVAALLATLRAERAETERMREVLIKVRARVTGNLIEHAVMDADRMDVGLGKFIDAALASVSRGKQP